MVRFFAKDVIKYFPSQIISAIVGLISVPIISRLFLPADYGDYILVLSTVTVLATLVGWLNMGIIRFYPAYERDKKLDIFYNTVLKWLFISVFGISILFLSIFFITKSYISQNFYDFMLVGLGVFVCMSFFGTLSNFLRIKRLVGWYTVFSVWKSIAAIGFGLILVIIFKFGIEGLLWGIILSIFLALPWLWGKAVGKLCSFKKKISLNLTKEMAKYSFPLVVANLTAWIMSLSDRYVLKFFRGSQEMGIYSASYDISEKSIMLIASLFMLASGPVSMNIWEKEGEEKSREFVSQLARYYLIICLPIAFGLSILAQPLMKLLTAPEYLEGYKIFPFVTFGVFFLGLQWIFQFGLRYYKKTHLTMFCIIISGLLNIELNFLLVPRYGYMAAAVTTFISYVFLLVSMALISRRFFAWGFPLKTLAKVSCALAVMEAAVYYIGNSLTSSTLINLISGVCIGVVVYISMLFLLREPQREEIQVLRTIRGKILARMIR